MKSTVSLPSLSSLARLGSLALLVAGALLLGPNGCAEGHEGDRCNPDLATGETECGGGLTCQQPTDCPESYCCPADGTSANPLCQAGCAGGQASICDAGGDADCAQVDGG